jgi:predicted nuclease of predicted toxin-antitoxin system
MKFKLDENLPGEAAELLDEAGHDARTILEQEMGGDADPIVARTIQREERALLTLDVGFGNIQQYPPADYHGIIVLRLRRQDKKSVLEVVERLVEQLPRESLTGQLWIVDENEIRIWSDDEA